MLALGNFNNTLDRLTLTPRRARSTTGRTAFASLLSELGLHDVWRERHTDVRCYSTMHYGLSRIDLGLGNGTLMQQVRDSAY